MEAGFAAGVAQGAALNPSARAAWMSELRAIGALAIPVIIQTSAQQGMTVTDQVFLGHLGTSELAAAALANAYTNLMWFFLLGFATALDTLGSHAYGAGDHRALVTWCVAAFLLLTVLVGPIAVGMGLGEAAGRTLFGQDAHTAALMGRFCKGLIPGMWPLMWGIVMTKYLQVQNNMLTPSLIAVAAFGLNVAFNAALVRTIGFRGAPLATSLSRWAQCLLLVGAVWHHERRRARGLLKERFPARRTTEDSVGVGQGERDEGALRPGAVIALADVTATAAAATGPSPLKGVLLVTVDAVNGAEEEMADGARVGAAAGDMAAIAGGGDGSANGAALVNPATTATHASTPPAPAHWDAPNWQRPLVVANGSEPSSLCSSETGEGSTGRSGLWSRDPEGGAAMDAHGEGQAWWRAAVGSCREAMRPRVLVRFLRLGIPGGLSMSFEAGCFDFSTVLAGRLGSTATAAHAAMLSIITLTYVAGPFALATAGAIRVGNLLGAGEPDGARRAAVTAVSLSGSFMAVAAVILLSCRGVLGYMFTRDAQVVQVIRELVVFAALFQISDGLMGSSQGVLRGCGHQHLTAVYNFTGFWVCGVLLGYLLCFKAGRGLAGLWTGITCGDTATCVLNLVAMARIRWPREADKAVARLKALAEQAEEEQAMLGPSSSSSQAASGAAGRHGGSTGDARSGDIDSVPLGGGGRSFAGGLKRIWSERQAAAAAWRRREQNHGSRHGGSVAAKLFRSVSSLFRKRSRWGGEAAEGGLSHGAGQPDTGQLQLLP